MNPAQFSVHAARTVDEAVAMLAKGAPHDGRVIAGGQSLVPAMALRLASLPAHLIDIPANLTPSGFSGLGAAGRGDAIAGDAAATACNTAPHTPMKGPPCDFPATR